MHRTHRSFLLLGTFSLLALPLVVGTACSAGNSTSGGFGGSSGDGNPTRTGSGMPDSASTFVGSGAGNPTSTGSGTPDPTTCAGAATSHSYVGCDFWPTVNANNVWSIFDFAVVVANTGDTMVTATATAGAAGAMVATTNIPPNSLGTLYLPWVASLKGADADVCGQAAPLAGSVVAPGGAYHLTTTAPVTVYQFNALEYQGAGGQPGKQWGSCPGNMQCCDINCQNGLTLPYKTGCFSFSNDASLLLPSTAMTGNYRLIGHEGWIFPQDPQTNPTGPTPVLGPDFTVTGTADGTNVTINLAPTGAVLAGGTIPATPGGGVVTFSLNAGDVVEIAGDPTSDFSGSLIQADKPVQVISGMPCVDIPAGDQACDHIEESVVPAETLGKHYFVTRVSAPNLNQPPQAQWVKIYGNADGTNLTYPAGVMPPNAPATLNAGQVVDLGEVNVDFEIEGDHEFAVSTFTLAAQDVDPNHRMNQKGDPAQSIAIAVEQYRDKYIFLAPLDYPANYVDVIQPMGSVVTLDGSNAPAPTPIGSSTYGINHLILGQVHGGVHTLTASTPVGIQVVGYGAYTSYAYPGGLNLKQIAPPPIH